MGEIVTLTPTGATGAAPIVIVAEADFVPSLTDVAVSVTVAGLGTVAGAVYVIAAPDALVVGVTDPHSFAVAHDAAHVTPFAALSLLTVAVKLCVAFGVTDAVVGATVTATTTGVDPTSPVAFDPPPQPPNNPIPAASSPTLNNRSHPLHLRTRIKTVLRYCVIPLVQFRIPSSQETLHQRFSFLA
ncbi:MAG TPA: hypothetical protein VH022_10685 [Candidatus Acidoferrum sp.]|nr:hypothetical protein [Candidatus Acidoferrum sp.]